MEAIRAIKNVLESAAKLSEVQLLRKLKAAVVLTLAATVFGVPSQALEKSRTGASKTGAAADFFPMKKGMVWVYTTLSKGGRVLYESKVRVVDEIEDSKEVHSGAKKSFTIKSESPLETLTLKYKRQGNWTLLLEEEHSKDKYLNLKYEPPFKYVCQDMARGMSWTWHGRAAIGGTKTETMKVIGWEDVEVPAGKFRAIKVAIFSDTGGVIKTRYNWFAAGKGLVKQTREFGWDIARMELVKFTH